MTPIAHRTFEESASAMASTDTSPDLMDPVPRTSPTSPASPTTRREDPTPAPAEPEKQPLGLSATQLVGGALAAMTAAFLGSRFSLGGTVAGAAVASLIAAVGGAIYTTSLRRTRDKVRSVWSGGTRGVPTTVETTLQWTPTDATATRIDGVPTAVAARRVAGVSAAVSPRSPVALTEAQPSAPAERGSRVRRIVIRAVVGAVAIFGLTAVALTTIELLTGQSLAGNQGTTISDVRQSETAPRSEPTQAVPSSADPSPTSEPTAEPSAQPSAQPSTDASATPTAEPTPTEPSATPSASATPQGNPSGEAGSDSAQ